MDKLEKKALALDILMNQIKWLHEYFKDPIISEDSSLKLVKKGADIVLDHLLKFIKYGE